MLQKELPSVAALAFLGDAVHTRYIRTKLVLSGITHAKELNVAAQTYVTAVAQAQAYERIKLVLNESEQDVYRRAFNSTHINRPKNVSGETYRTATGFEAILGMLAVLNNEDRIVELLTIAYDTPSIQNHFN